MFQPRKMHWCNGMKGKKHDHLKVEKATEKINHLCMMKTTQQTRFEENHHDRIQAVYVKPQPTSHSMVKD